MLRRKLVPWIENFPFLLKCFIRPMDYDVKPPKCHNWGDIYFYNSTTIIRIYGFLEKPFVLPRYVPLRLGFIEVMRQISMLQDTNFSSNKRKDTFFLDLTIFHHFVVIGLGRNELVYFLRPYNMTVTSKRFNDKEGFYARLMKRISLPSRGIHEFDFPKDIIMNDEEMKSQRNKKSY